MTQKEDLEGKCLFCKVGDGKVEYKEIEHKWGNKPMYKEREYTCSLGERGKDCVIPKIMNMLYKAIAHEHVENMVFR